MPIFGSKTVILHFAIWRLNQYSPLYAVANVDMAVYTGSMLNILRKFTRNKAWKKRSEKEKSSGKDLNLEKEAKEFIRLYGDALESLSKK